MVPSQLNSGKRGLFIQGWHYSYIVIEKVQVSGIPFSKELELWRWGLLALQGPTKPGCSLGQTWEITIFRGLPKYVHIKHGDFRHVGGFSDVHKPSPSGIFRNTSRPRSLVMSVPSSGIKVLEVQLQFFELRRLWQELASAAADHPRGMRHDTSFTEKSLT